MHDPSGRRGLWTRWKTQDVEAPTLEICGGREGDDYYVCLATGKALSLADMTTLEDAFATCAWMRDTYFNDEVYALLRCDEAVRAHPTVAAVVQLQLDRDEARELACAAMQDGLQECERLRAQVARITDDDEPEGDAMDDGKTETKQLSAEERPAKVIVELTDVARRLVDVEAHDDVEDAAVKLAGVAIENFLSSTAVARDNSPLRVGELYGVKCYGVDSRQAVAFVGGCDDARHNPPCGIGGREMPGYGLVIYQAEAWAESRYVLPGPWWRPLVDALVLTLQEELCSRRVMAARQISVADAEATRRAGIRQVASDFAAFAAAAAAYAAVAPAGSKS